MPCTDPEESKPEYYHRRTLAKRRDLNRGSFSQRSAGAMRKRRRIQRNNLPNRTVYRPRPPPLLQMPQIRPQEPVLYERSTMPPLRPRGARGRRRSLRSFGERAGQDLLRQLLRPAPGLEYRVPEI